MSFANATELAMQRGIVPQELRIGHHSDENLAQEILSTAIPQALQAGWQLLAHLAPVLREIGQPVDECLHCLLAGRGDQPVPGKGHTLAQLGRISQLPGGAGWLHIPSKQRVAVVKALARLSMFDVPRHVVGTQLGVWPFYLMGHTPDNSGGVYLFSPVPNPSLPHAFIRHATRLGWTAEEGYPTFTSAADAEEYVQSIMTAKFKRGLAHLQGLANQLPSTVQQVQLLDDIEDPLLEQEIQAWLGSLTGRALLVKLTGHAQWQFYNCCTVATGPISEGKPKGISFVAQLQNQLAHRVNC